MIKPTTIAKKVTTLLLSATLSGLLPASAQTNNPSVSPLHARGEGPAGEALPALRLAQQKVSTKSTGESSGIASSQTIANRLDVRPAQETSVVPSAVPLPMSPRTIELRRVREEMRAHGVPDVGGNTGALNAMGYRAMYEENDPKKALMYFGWNLVLFPKQEAQLRDSLAEGYLQAGDIKSTIENYSIALDLDPTQKSDGSKIIARLKSDPKSLPELQREARQAYLAYRDSQLKQSSR